MKRFFPTVVILTGLGLIMAVPIIDHAIVAASKPATRANTVVITVAPKPPNPVASTTPTTSEWTETTTPVGACPQEDSCAIDYRSDGQWHITPDTP